MSLSAGGTFQREDALRNGLVVDVTKYAKLYQMPWPVALSKAAYQTVKPNEYEVSKQMDQTSKRIMDILLLYCKNLKVEKKSVFEFLVPLFRWSDQPLLQTFVGVLHRETKQDVLTIVLPEEVEFDYTPKIEIDGKLVPLMPDKVAK